MKFIALVLLFSSSSAWAEYSTAAIALKVNYQGIRDAQARTIATSPNISVRYVDDGQTCVVVTAKSHFRCKLSVDSWQDHSGSGYPVGPVYISFHLYVRPAILLAIAKENLTWSEPAFQRNFEHLLGKMNRDALVEFNAEVTGSNLGGVYTPPAHLDLRAIDLYNSDRSEQYILE